MRWSFFLSFKLLSTSWCNHRVALRRKFYHRQVLPWLLPILSKRGRVLPIGRLSVITFFASCLDLHLCIIWGSVPTVMTMTHLGLFLGCPLKITWRPEIGIQWYLWMLPQLVSSLVLVRIRIVSRLVRRQPRRVVLTNGWIPPERHHF